MELTTSKFLPRNFQSSSITQWQIAMQRPHLTANEKAQTKRFVIVPENVGFPCGIDDPRVSAAAACLPSVILRVLGTMLFCWELFQWFGKGSHFSKWGCTGIDHEIPCHSRRRVDEIVATVCSRIKIRRFLLLPLVENRCSISFEFLLIKIDKCWEQFVQSTIVSVNNSVFYRFSSFVRSQSLNSALVHFLHSWRKSDLKTHITPPK